MEGTNVLATAWNDWPSILALDLMDPRKKVGVRATRFVFFSKDGSLGPESWSCKKNYFVVELLWMTERTSLFDVHSQIRLFVSNTPSLWEGQTRGYERLGRASLNRTFTFGQDLDHTKTRPRGFVPQPRPSRKQRVKLVCDELYQSISSCDLRTTPSLREGQTRGYERLGGRAFDMRLPISDSYFKCEIDFMQLRRTFALPD